MKKYIMIIRYVSLIVHKVMWMTQAAVPVIQNIYENVTYLNMLITITNCSPTINSTLPIVTIHYMCTWNDKYSCHSEGEYPSLYCLIKTHCFCNFMQCLSSPKGVNLLQGLQVQCYTLWGGSLKPGPDQKYCEQAQSVQHSPCTLI